jgi:peroxiredoxin
VIKYLPHANGEPIKRINERDAISVLLGRSAIEIFSVDSFANASINGSEENDEYNKIKAMQKTYNERTKELSTEYINSKDAAAIQKAREKLDALEAEIKEKVFRTYLRNNPGSPIGLFVLKQYAGKIFDPELVEPLYQGLSAEQKKYESAAILADLIEKAKRFSVGNTAADFVQNDTSGMPVKLSSFRGKYVLIDFWASWCGPCRKENPNLVKNYQAYKRKGFDILGVSLDREGDRNEWLKAIHDDNLTWTHVSDLKHETNEVAVRYGIKSIPQNLLLDPQGKIIAKNIRGEALTKKLAVLFP